MNRTVHFDIFRSPRVKRVSLLESGEDHDKLSTCISIYCLWNTLALDIFDRAWWLIAQMNRRDTTVDLDLNCSLIVLSCLLAWTSTWAVASLYFPVSQRGHLYRTIED